MADASIPQVDVATLAPLVATGAYVLDVRTPDEYRAAHVPRAVPLPLAELESRVGEVPDDRPVYVICHSGGRSAVATGLLRAIGIDATNVAGGTAGWVEAGHQVAVGDGDG